MESGNTVSDYFPVEKEYGYSVFSTVFSVEWQDRKLNFIDCPGSDDFIGGAVSALNVTDTALMVLMPSTAWKSVQSTSSGIQNNFISRLSLL